MTVPESTETLVSLAVALGIGLLVGMERGWNRREEEEGSRVAGWRTFGLIGLLGGVLAISVPFAGGGLLVCGLAAVALFFALGYWRESDTADAIGITTEVAAIATFALGALAGHGEMAVAASAAIVMTMILGFKPEMQGLLQRLERRELLATLRLLLISVVFLSLLPDEGFGPWQAINPDRIWRMVVVIATIGYVGYFAIRLIGPAAGLAVTALLGALVSSTAVTIGLSKQAAREPERRPILAAGIGLASSVMLLRLTVVGGIVAPAILVPLAVALIPAALAGAVVAGLQLRHAMASDTPAEQERGNPLDLGGAMKMGTIFALAAFLVQAAQNLIGSAALYPLAGIAGLVNVDAISISLAGGVAAGSIEAATAATAILIAALVNTLVKPVMAGAIAGSGLAVRLAPSILVSVAAGVGGWFTAQGMDLPNPFAPAG
ncbi:uncharacterized membrane protein (DUF4010 family) [Stella humosa]|uniref:Uncharacterized membrane protein (DUF4010 family) n=1 Tax=Stella humosa TaxID=94 RepID=A0A3N1M6W4_9PROT|nr:MgtC/SapB family protein [Stella humosa]ROP99487.1 uncharacterized membrane protein (DUF4010 family) [Stella humosa]BBK31300.1 hypothetical protein STHU_19340 [Stella humosa]